MWNWHREILHRLEVFDHVGNPVQYLLLESHYAIKALELDVSLEQCQASQSYFLNLHGLYRLWLISLDDRVRLKMLDQLKFVLRR